MTHTLKRMKHAVIIFVALLTSCNRMPPAPEPYGAVPSEAQLKWQKMEYYMFVHFGPNTFTDVEWGDGKEDPRVFNPSDVDCRQWAETAKLAGMKGIIITAKHHDGFCLWPSNYSTHTVRESLWKEGKGDLLKELSEACHEYGLKFGVYLSPWDQNHPDYGTPRYNQTFSNTLTEVLSNYGEVFEQWFDGANGEGHGGKKQIYDWPLFHATVYKYQPNAVIFSDVGPGCRWMGNEKGYAGETNWSRLNVEGFEPGRLAPPTDTLSMGNIHGAKWVPAEADVSIRPGWFYSPSTDDKVKSIGDLMAIYHASVGRNANLLLNVPPDRRGRIHEHDSIRLMEFRKAIDEAFASNLAQGKISADAVRGNHKAYGPENLLDGRYDTYWTTDDGVTASAIELEFLTPQQFNRMLIQEYIPLGQRISRFNIEYWDDQTNAWQRLAEATTVGYKRIVSFPAVTAKKVRLNITASLACPILNNLEIYHAPDYTLASTLSIPNQGTGASKYVVISPHSGEVSLLTDGKTDGILRVEAKTPVILDLDELVEIKGFFYLPEAQVSATNISRYNFYVSADNKNWTKLKSNALFHNVKNNPVMQEVKFEHDVQARFIKLEAVELTTDYDKYSIVEIGVIR